MKIHKNNATHRGVSKRSTYFLLYTAAFLICSACIYVWFARTGRSLISTGDGWKQHFPAFVYFGQYGRTVLRTLLTEHQLVLPQWNFSLGYGGDILTTLHYYVIGDPLDLLSIACPTRYAVYLYSFLSLFRLYLAGLGFGAFCRYKMQGAPLPVAVGSVCYVFFTYSFLLVARHPFFAIPMVYLPLGYTYDSAITRADYEKLSSLEKQQALLQGVVLDSVPTGTAQATLSFTDKSLPYTITADKDVAIDGKKIHVYDKGAKVTLHFNGKPNSETYLRMGLRNYTDYPAYTYYKTQENDPLHRYSTDKWNKKDDSQKAYVRRKARSFKAPSSLTLQYTAHTADGAALTPQSTVTCTQTHLRFEGYKVQMVNTGYSKEAKTDITVTFNARGIYDFSTLEVLEQPMTDTDRQVAKLAENTLENIQIGTDTVDGTVTLDRSKILLLTIPYCDGWTATVDGKEAQLLQANAMFSALALEPGEHTIHLTYRTPHLKAGLAVSVLGFAAFGATLLCTEVKKRKERKA